MPQRQVATRERGGRLHNLYIARWRRGRGSPALTVSRPARVNRPWTVFFQTPRKLIFPPAPAHATFSPHFSQDTCLTRRRSLRIPFTPKPKSPPRSPTATRSPSPPPSHAPPRRAPTPPRLPAAPASHAHTHARHIPPLSLPRSPLHRTNSLSRFPARVRVPAPPAQSFSDSALPTHRAFADIRVPSRRFFLAHPRPKCIAPPRPYPVYDRLAPALLRHMVDYAPPWPMPRESMHSVHDMSLAQVTLLFSRFCRWRFLISCLRSLRCPRAAVQRRLLLDCCAASCFAGFVTAISAHARPDRAVACCACVYLLCTRRAMAIAPACTFGFASACRSIVGKFRNRVAGSANTPLLSPCRFFG